MTSARSFTEEEELPDGLGSLSQFSGLFTRAQVMDRLALHEARHFALRNLDRGLLVSLDEGIDILPYRQFYLWRDKHDC